MGVTSRALPVAGGGVGNAVSRRAAGLCTDLRSHRARRGLGPPASSVSGLSIYGKVVTTTTLPKTTLDRRLQIFSQAGRQ